MRLLGQFKLFFFFYGKILHAPKAPKAPKAQKRNQAKAKKVQKRK